MTHPPPPDQWPDPSVPPPAPPAPPLQPNFAADDRWLVGPPPPPAVPYGTAGAAPPGYAYPPGFGPAPGFGYPPPPPRTNGLAVASMVVSIAGAVSLLCVLCLMPLAVVALGGGITGTILGFVARRQIRARGDAGAGMALAGVIVGLITSSIGLLAIVVVVLWLGVAVSGGGLQ